ncbi:class I SAM-dependent methyltransferase [Oleidesulfovibrio sp.]|uniref:tRNA (mnm(5)s(2)U34)-methyltransferase n=1 Tax=Oleidesulfovibrio sp. TaxID=2909707 RepID=UPI003A89504B
MSQPASGRRRSQLPSIIEFTHSLLKRVLQAGDIALDATTGNGHDTMFLAACVGPQGHVYGFDVQQQAVENTAQRLQDNGAEGYCTLFHCGHEEVARRVPDMQGRLSCAMFNLGYLPGSDKSVVTRHTTTIAALESLKDMLKPGGLITLHLYAGHAGGDAEAQAVEEYCNVLPWPEWRVLRYDFANKQKNRETLLVLEKSVC